MCGQEQFEMPEFAQELQREAFERYREELRAKQEREKPALEAFGLT